MPRRMNRSDRTSITSIALSLRATRIARHSWVNSSSTLSIRYLRPIVGAILDEVIGPDMIAPLRPQPDARSVGQPEPAALGLLMGDLQPLEGDDRRAARARHRADKGDAGAAASAVLDFHFPRHQQDKQFQKYRRLVPHHLLYRLAAPRIS